MKKFFSEFKTFITRGNVMDMAVGVIVGSAFTAIVNGLSENILKPIINWFLALILGADTLSNIFTFLKRVEIVDETGAAVVDLTQSIYIDWGAFINAVINFFIVAFVLFTIVKFMNKLKEGHNELEGMFKVKLSKADRAELKAQGINRKDKAAVEAYFEDKARKASEEKARLEAEAQEAARIERENNPTELDVLKQILAQLKTRDDA